MSPRSTIEALRCEAHRIDHQENHGTLLEQIGDASIVLLGAETHGTHEFYRVRAQISQRLIAEKGFDAIAVEADWPDALRVNHYIQLTSGHLAQTTAGGGPVAEDPTAEQALQGFQRFPQWMWRNTEVVSLVDWLRAHNSRLTQPQDRIGFFGLDLYSLRSSMDAVVRYLEQVDPDAAELANIRYACFDRLANDPHRYGYAATFGMQTDCELEVTEQFDALCTDSAQYLSGGGQAAADELFYAQQNARVARNAEAYYRTMFLSRKESWNIRDSHMAQTVHALRDHIASRKGGQAKLIVWAHNSHIGDARATEMGARGQINVGQLIREQCEPEDVFLLGFTTHSGTVTAAQDWDSPAELKQLRPPRPDSVESLFHATGLGNFLLPIRGRPQVADQLHKHRLERAIGVLYSPENGTQVGDYFYVDPARQFDALIHLDRTHALKPIDHAWHWQEDEMPETYPSGI